MNQFRRYLNDHLARNGSTSASDLVLDHKIGEVGSRPSHRAIEDKVTLHGLCRTLIILPIDLREWVLIVIASKSAPATGQQRCYPYGKRSGGLARGIAGESTIARVGAGRIGAWPTYRWISSWPMRCRILTP